MSSSSHLYILKSTSMRTVTISIEGIVQGVGFRPFVYKRAREHGLGGFVRNTPGGVEILAQGRPERVEAFLSVLRSEPPPQARIERIRVEEREAFPAYGDFSIVESSGEGGRTVRISPDLALCPACREELFDPRQRRYYYPFINCTNCGPRFTIVLDIPYDRAQTTMAAFHMCPDCLREYEDPEDRRFHAQPNACHVCGPRIRLVDNGGAVRVAGTDAATVKTLITEACSLLDKGLIVGVKGLGGYHVACRADIAETVSLLRTRKRREEKPFALMVRDVAMAEGLVRLDDADRKRLADVDAPILLLEKRSGHGLAEEVAPLSTTFGVMLPATPLQHLLAAGLDMPLVMTSGNVSDEPIAYTEEDALNRLAAVCDYFITGERGIHMRNDDSVIRLIRGRDYPVRRSRGFVPLPVVLKFPAVNPVLAVGAELKNTVCLVAERTACLSQHIGDMENASVYRSFTDIIRHFMKLQEVTPRVVAHDLHPGYLSTQFALDPPPGFDWVLETLKFPVQHHHAHIASALAEHGIQEKVIGVALDGTGLGADGTIWGGEILEADLFGFTRLGSLEPMAMPGGDLAVREPWRMSLSCVHATFGRDWEEHLSPALESIPSIKRRVTVHQLENGTGLPLTSGCGRLFDAFSALAGVCLDTRYEGQPAVMFEQCADRQADETGYEFPVHNHDDVRRIDWKQAVRQAVADLRSRRPASVIAARFHAGLARVMTETAVAAARERGHTRVVLSGGCFLNRLLLERMMQGLEAAGLTPVVHTRVPCNDGGISLGQAAVAAANLGERRRN